MSHLEYATLTFELNRHQSQTVTIELDADDLDGITDVDDIDPYDYTQRAMEEADRSGWDDYDWDCDTADVSDYAWGEDDEDEDEESEAQESSWAKQTEPDRAVLPGKLILDRDGDIFEVERVRAEFMVLLKDGEPTDDYGGSARWDQGVGGSFNRWYRPGQQVIDHDGKRVRVKGTRFSRAHDAHLVELMDGREYLAWQLADFRWGDELDDEEEATA